MSKMNWIKDGDTEVHARLGTVITVEPVESGLFKFVVEFPWDVSVTGYKPTMGEAKEAAIEEMRCRMASP